MAVGGRGERTGRPVVPGAEACGWVGGRAHSGVVGERGETEARTVVCLHDDAVNVFRHRSQVCVGLSAWADVRRALQQR